MRKELLKQLTDEQRAMAMAEWREARHANAVELEAHAAQLAELRQALRAYDIAGPLTECRRQALGTILTLAHRLTEE